MPKKGKKKNKQTTIDENEDWADSGSEDNQTNSKQMNTSDPLQAAMAAVGKKKKGKKGKGVGAAKAAPLEDNWDDDLENEIGPPPDFESGGKNKKKNKKKKKDSAFNEQKNDFDDEDDVQDMAPKGNKKKKNKKKKGKKGGGGNDEEMDLEALEAEIAALEAEEGVGGSKSVSSDFGNNNNKGKKGKKNKKGKNNNAAKERQLEQKKLERQEAIMEYYKETIGTLDEKYDEYFEEGSEMYELFEGAVMEVVGWYDNSSNKDKLNDDDIFNNKINELDNTWNELLDLMKSQWEEDNAESLEEKRKREQQEKIAQLEAAGIKIGRGGGGGGQKQMSAKQRQKLEEKKRLKEMREKLKEIDRQQREKELAEEKEKEKETQRVQKEQKEKEAKKAKELAAKKAAQANDDWDDDSSDDDGGKGNDDFNDDSDDDFGPTTSNGKKGGKGNKNNNNNNNQKNKNKNQNKQQGGGNKKKKKQKFDDDESDPEVVMPKKGRKRRKGKGGANNNNNNNNNKNNSNSNGNKNDGKATQSPTPSKNEDNEEQNDEKDEKKDETKDEDIIHEIDPKDAKGKGKKGKKPLRSPICVVMGHVDTGKTLILDKIRHSSVQHGEAGGITQQIGATYLSIEYIKKECQRMSEQFGKQKYKVPGLLFIDTPGHESFTNLRQRGSSMCDIAVLVVDITGGIEKQTAESLKMLKEGNIPFIVALNKIDRCIDWKVDNGAPFRTTYDNQEKHTKNDFEKRLGNVQLDFSNHGWNTSLYFKNKNLDKDISLVPTSAMTGEGIPDLMFLLTRLTQKYMQKTLQKTKFKCNVLEVKTVQGYGATIDVILSGGTIESEDTIIVCGMEGCIVTKVRALLLPHEGQEMRVRGEYQRVNEVNASAGVRIAAHDSLDTAVAGSQLLILDRKYRDPNKWKRERKNDIDEKSRQVQSAFNNLKNLISKTGRGVYVQASTLGALEALITFLQGMNVPMCGFNIGNVHKSDVMKASIQKQYQREYCLILAFNVRVSPDAREMAEHEGVQIFEEEIIYQLHQRFEEYITGIRNAKKDQAKDIAVFPVEMQITSPEHVFNNKNPIVIGVEIQRGTLRLNTPIVVKLYEEHKTSEGIISIGKPLYLGNITSIQSDHKDKPKAVIGDKVAIRIEGDESVKNVQVGRSFSLKEKLIARISRASLDALKQHFGDELEQDDINHLGMLKKYFEII